MRFPSFKHAYVSNAGSSSQDATLEGLWKTASARAFEIDTESNDGLEDICLLFSQQTRSTKDDSTQASADRGQDTEDEGNRTDEDDVYVIPFVYCPYTNQIGSLENDIAVLCRYRVGDLCLSYFILLTLAFPRRRDTTLQKLLVTSHETQNVPKGDTNARSLTTAFELHHATRSTLNSTRASQLVLYVHPTLALFLRA